ncbi:DNA-directed RNA polymerases I and III subunit RPAC2 [Pristis pectinata]|uniref:DNA-directed RNA polymerases I and III subunit RPAC2 n=1 Tax=Pristis pectinata TaxID=685728 RepID=UPI00223E1C10|nr:DNA-directed RNA polymerases I and III subunit RPAC2 [Pristis pectinata]
MERFTEMAQTTVPNIHWGSCVVTQNRSAVSRLISSGSVSMATVEGAKKPVLEVVQAEGCDDSSVTFVLHDEDHTLGNSLRYMIMKNPEVEFCGYSITHPSESKINFRIQTRGGIPSIEPFRRGLNELMTVCQHVLNTFEDSVKEYKEQHKQEAMDQF